MIVTKKPHQPKAHARRAQRPHKPKKPGAPRPIAPGRMNNGIWTPPRFERDRFDGPRTKPVDLAGAGTTGTQTAQGYVPATPPSPSVPTVVLSYFGAKQVDSIFASLARANLPAGTPIYMGTYDASPQFIEKVHAAGARYAPAFRPFGREKELEYQGRTPGVPGDARYAGPVPKLTTLSAEERVNWGAELGRRFRDKIRAMGPDAKVDAWQLDEIVPSMVGGENQVALRQFFRGVLDGISGGRPELGDRHMKGIVHCSVTRDLGLKKNDAQMKAFWKSLDEATFRVAGEEYVSPRQSAKAEAELEDQYHDELYGDPHADNVAKKYIVGLTPGFNGATSRGYGGRAPGMTDAEWTAWQRDYAKNRADDSGVAGFGGYNFVGDNSTPERIDSIIQNIAAGIRAAWGM